MEINSINILLVDDHKMFVDGIKMLLENQSGIKVVAEASNGIEALKILETCEINFVVTDISMPEMNGIELTKKIKQLHPSIKVLVLSMNNDRAIVGEIMMSEAEGYILKNTGREELVNAINKISNGGTFYSNEIVKIMMDKVKKEKQQDQELKLLSEREIEIVKLIVEENSSEEIAQKLFISKRTVDTHRTNIMDKIKVQSVVGLIKFAYRNNLVSQG